MIGKIPEELKEIMKDPGYLKKQGELWLKSEAQHIKQFGRKTNK
ncbi:TPA: hypothetical protein ACRMAA_002011 [Pseudomonas aeruginosa]